MAIAFVTTPAGERIMAQYKYLPYAGDLAIIGICLLLALGANK